jgi:precorrin-2 C(20)-methyltransferase
LTAKGTLYALGLGPGNPDLVTVRAAQLLGQVPVVAFPTDSSGDRGRAYQIARSYLRSEVEELPLTLPMTGEMRVLEQAWETAVAALCARTEEGQDVAYLCLGDTLLYGSFGYLLARYPGTVEIVPGVISPVAAAASLGVPLVEGREPLTVLPDGADVERLRAALELEGTLVIMKPSRLSPKAVSLLEETGAASRAWVTQDVSLEGERVFAPGASGDLASLPYFSLVVIPPAGREPARPPASPARRQPADPPPVGRRP